MRKRSYFFLLIGACLLCLFLGLFAVLATSHPRAASLPPASGAPPLVITPPLFPINSIALSSDGQRLALGYGDGILCTWQTRTGQLVSTHIDADRFLYSKVLGWSADGKNVISTGYSSPLQVWNGSTGQMRFSLEHLSLPILSHDHRALASIGTPASVVNIWDITTGRLVRSIDTHASTVDSFAWSPTGALLAIRVFSSASSSSAQVQVWNIATGQQILTMSSPDSQVGAVTWSPSDTLLAITRDTGDFTHGTVQVWNTSTVRLVSTYISPTGVPIQALAWSPDGTQVVSATYRPGPSYVEQIWDAATGNVIFTYPADPGQANHLEWSGKRIVSWYDNQYGGSVLVWDATTGKTILALDQHDTSVYGGSISPDGQSVIVLSRLSMQLFDLTTGKNLVRYNDSDQQSQMQWSHDGSSLVSIGPGRASLWQANKNQRLFSFAAHHQRENAVTWSPDGIQIAAEDGATFEVGIWNATTGEALGDLHIYHEELGRIFYEQKMAIGWSLDGAHIAESRKNSILVWGNQPVICNSNECISDGGQHSDRVTALAWSPDSTHLASASRDKTVLIRDIKLQRDVLIYRGHADVVTTLGWSPDGTVLASGSLDTTIHIWKATSGVRQMTLYAKSPVLSLAWSPDGKRLAAATQDGKITLWDMLTGRPLLVYSGHTGPVTSVGWSPDGTMLASAGADKTVRIWNAASGKTIFVYRGHNDTVLSVQWSPNGKHIASASSDGTIQIWQPGRN